MIGKVLMAAALGLAMLAGPGTAQAETHANGVRMNGIRINGMKLNGLRLNGVHLNGIQLNGIRMNGQRLNGGDAGAHLQVGSAIRLADGRSFALAQ